MKKSKTRFWVMSCILMGLFAFFERSLYTPAEIQRIRDHGDFDSSKAVIAQLNYLNSSASSANAGAVVKPPPSMAPEPLPVIGWPAAYYGRERIISAGYEKDAHFIAWGVAFDLLVCVGAALSLSALLDLTFKSAKTEP